MNRQLALWLAAAAVVAVAGVFAGRAIKGSGGADFPFDTRADAYSAADLPQGRTRAGFTGFSETGGLDGTTIVAGKVTAVAGDSVTLTTSSGASSIRLTAEQKLRILQPLGGAIAPGTTVVIIKKQGTDEAQAVLALLDP